MKLVFIRHADPDYVNDTLTPKGRREAEILSERLILMPADKVYVSHLGRALDTARPYLEKCGKEPVILDWLEEFPCRIDRPDDETKKHIVWDWLPQDWTREDRFYDISEWTENDRLRAGGVREKYEEVTAKFDELIAGLGYVRDGNIYTAKYPNMDTVLFFCHFGVEMVMLSRLFNISPMILWHSMCAAPTSLTTVVTEERRKGTASFRMLGFGDVSHLVEADEEISFQARFCEMYDNLDERHD
ncbi:MAG: histidine phosphatase family protein [Lachnospiraceae bacterium]|nr:histidine phosphatase family protein [Lachnospiraceae bacterium]